mmetsp:Transcript_31331/g.63673  ORF Transcript_31331/g.63673 Transcript_31331/m.63673 type:complete len:626 (+) Transcript_31331:59-1936(+)
MYSTSTPATATDGDRRGEGSVYSVSVGGTSSSVNEGGDEGGGDSSMGGDDDAQRRQLLQPDADGTCIAGPASGPTGIRSTGSAAGDDELNDDPHVGVDAADGSSDDDDDAGDAAGTGNSVSPSTARADNTTGTGRNMADTSAIDMLDLPGRYEPESMRHLDVEATLAALGEGPDDDGNYTYSMGGGGIGGAGAATSYMAAAGGPYRGRGGSATTYYERRRRRRRVGITSLIFLGAAGVTAVSVLATFGVIELEEVYVWIRGEGSAGDTTSSETDSSSSSFVMMDGASQSRDSIGTGGKHYFLSKHMLVDRTDDCEDMNALHTHDGWEACERACMSASCCHEPPGDKLSCVTSKTKSLCSEYTELCGRLHTIVEPPGGKDAVAYVPPAPNNLVAICSEESISTAAGLMRCEETCHYSRCCKYQGGDNGGVSKLRNCYAGNEDACALYDRPCHILPGFDHDKAYEAVMKEVKEVLSSSGHHGINDEIIADLCSENSLQEHVGRESCKEVCRSHICCFAGAGYGVENMNVCPPDLADDCPSYTPCRIAYLSGIGNGARNPSDPEGAFDSRSDIVEAVKDACEELDGGAKCHEVCDAHMCCFVADTGDCPAKKGEACDVFEPCKSLLPS